MRFGMSEKLGPRVFGHDHGQPFLGREFSSEPDYSDEIAREIDDEIRRIVECAHQRAKRHPHRAPRARSTTISEILLKRETIEKEEFDRAARRQDRGGGLRARRADDAAARRRRPRPTGRRETPRPLPRPGLAGGGAEARGLELPEKPEPGVAGSGSDAVATGALMAPVVVSRDPRRPWPSGSDRVRRIEGAVAVGGSAARSCPVGGPGAGRRWGSRVGRSPWDELETATRGGRRPARRGAGGRLVQRRVLGIRAMQGESRRPVGVARSTAIGDGGRVRRYAARSVRSSVTPPARPAPRQVDGPWRSPRRCDARVARPPGGSPVDPPSTARPPRTREQAATKWRRSMTSGRGRARPDVAAPAGEGLRPMRLERGQGRARLTGASRDIGLAVATAAGARRAAPSRIVRRATTSPSPGTVAALEAPTGGEACGASFDVADDAALEGFVDAAAQILGGRAELDRRPRGRQRAARPSLAATTGDARRPADAASSTCGPRGAVLTPSRRRRPAAQGARRRRERCVRALRSRARARQPKAPYAAAKAAGSTSRCSARPRRSTRRRIRVDAA